MKEEKYELFKLRKEKNYVKRNIRKNRYGIII